MPKAVLVSREFTNDKGELIKFKRLVPENNQSDYKLPKFYSHSRVNTYVRPYNEEISDNAIHRLNKFIGIRKQKLLEESKLNLEEDLFSDNNLNDSKLDELENLENAVINARSNLALANIEAQNNGKYAEEVVTALIEQREINMEGLIYSEEGQLGGELMYKEFKKLSGSDNDLELLPNGESFQLRLYNPDKNIWTVSIPDFIFRRKSTGKLVLGDWKYGTEVKAEKYDSVLYQTCGVYYWDILEHFGEAPAEVYVISAEVKKVKINDISKYATVGKTRDLLKLIKRRKWTIEEVREHFLEDLFFYKQEQKRLELFEARKGGAEND